MRINLRGSGLLSSALHNELNFALSKWVVPPTVPRSKFAAITLADCDWRMYRFSPPPTCLPRKS